MNLKRMLTILLKGVTKEDIEQPEMIYGYFGELKVLLAKILIKYQKNGSVNNIQNTEFRVFSQFGDDGIIQFLINKVGVSLKERVFVEFGVENYLESNTRFLLINNNWKGLVIDGSSENIDYIKKDEIYWKHDLTAIECFVTKENINEMIKKNGFGGKIGLLHVDIDGNDYWVWKAITSIEPVIVIVEYNSVFGNKRAVSVPYKSDFYRTKAHFSNLYWGASLQAFFNLAKEKGYCFIGTNSAGNNAYFVKKNRMSLLKSLTVKEGYTESKYRESRDVNGGLTFLSGKSRLEQIRGMPLVDIKSKLVFKIGEKDL